LGGIGPFELLVLGGQLVLLLGGIFAVYGLWRWASDVARERGGWYRAARWLPLLAALAPLLGLAFTVLGLPDAFDAVAHAPVDERSARLSESIAGSMAGVWGGCGAGALLLLTSAVVSLVGGHGAPTREPR
jgi:hypothetical protein